MTRQEQLLQALAQNFDDLRHFDGDFLREHEVTADECFDLCEVAALAIRAHCRLINDATKKGLAGELAKQRLVETIIAEVKL